MLLNKFLNPEYLFHPLQKKLLINTIHQLLVLHPALQYLSKISLPLLEKELSSITLI